MVCRCWPYICIPVDLVPSSRYMSGRIPKPQQAHPWYLHTGRPMKDRTAYCQTPTLSEHWAAGSAYCHIARFVEPQMDCTGWPLQQRVLPHFLMCIGLLAARTATARGHLCCATFTGRTPSPTLHPKCQLQGCLRYGGRFNSSAPI